LWVQFLLSKGGGEGWGYRKVKGKGIDKLKEGRSEKEIEKGKGEKKMGKGID
jgi:hypothetical protein